MNLNDAFPYALLDVLSDAEMRCLIDDLSREPLTRSGEFDEYA